MRVPTWTAALIGVLAVELLAAQVPTVRVGDHSLTRASQSTRGRLFGLVDLYRVALYLPPQRTTVQALRSAEIPVALHVEIRYSGSLPDSIPAEWKEELMPVLGAAQRQSLKRAYARLGPGDVIEIRFVPGEGTTLAVSGRRILSDPGFELIAALLNIWMGQTPVSEDIKRELLEGLR